jgi:hypothetical protein
MSYDDPDDSADGEGGDDHFSRVIEAVRTLSARLATLNPLVQPEDACNDFAEQVYSLLQFTEAIEESLGDSADLDFMAQDEFIRELAEEAGEELAAALREAGDAFQNTPWSAHQTPQARIDAISTAWAGANAAARALHATLTEVL